MTTKGEKTRSAPTLEDVILLPVTTLELASRRSSPWCRTFYEAGAPDNLRRHPVRWAGAASFSASLRLTARRALDDCDALVSSWCVPSGWVASTVASGRDHLCICHATDVRWLSKVPGGGALARRIAGGASALWFLGPTDRDRFLEVAALDPSTVATNLGPMPIAPPQSPGPSRAEGSGVTSGSTASRFSSSGDSFQ